MKKPTVVVFVLAAIAMIVALTIYYSYKKVQSQPDEEVRATVAHVSPSQIAAIRLEVLPDMFIITPNKKKPDTKSLGMQPGFQYEYKTNPTAIALLLKGLKKAERPTEYRLNRVNHITLIMKDGTAIGPFGFGKGARDDYFSPTFIDGLKKAGVKNIPRHSADR